MKPSTQSELFGMEKFFNEIINLYNKKKLPNKILLTGNKGLGKSTLAYHLINYILSNNEDHKYDTDNFKINENNKSFILLKKNCHPNFYLIDLVDEKKNIEINQVREMITYHNKSSFNNIPRFILIDNVENLNVNSTNALLKIIEEPNPNIFFILIHDNTKKILSTLRSRCLNFRINLSFHESIKITNLLLKDNVLNLINNDLINYYKPHGYLIKLIIYSQEKKIDLNQFDLKNFLSHLIDNTLYKKNRFIKEVLIDYIELFFLKEYKNSVAKKKLINIYYNFTNKINSANKFNLDEESLFMEFKSKILNG